MPQQVSPFLTFAAMLIQEPPLESTLRSDSIVKPALPLNLPASEAAFNADTVGFEMPFPLRTGAYQPKEFPTALQVDTFNGFQEEMQAQWLTRPIGTKLAIAVPSKFKPQSIPGIFKGHLLRAETLQPRPLARNSEPLPLVVLLLAITLMAIVNQYFRKRFDLFTKAFFIQRFAGQIAREENSLNQRLSILLSGIFLLSASLFAYLINRHFNLVPTHLNSFLQFGTILVGLLSFFGLKIILNQLVGFLFQVEREVREYLFHYLLLNQFLGIWLLLLCALLAYAATLPARPLVWIGAGAFVLIFGYRLARGLRVVSSNKAISGVYLFFYFCTLEILPLLWAFKVVLKG